MQVYVANLCEWGSLFITSLNTFYHKILSIDRVVFFVSNNFMIKLFTHIYECQLWLANRLDQLGDFFGKHTDTMGVP